MAAENDKREGDVVVEMAVTLEDKSKSLDVAAAGLTNDFETPKCEGEEEMRPIIRERMEKLVTAATAAAAAPTNLVPPLLDKVTAPLMRIIARGGGADQFINALEKCFREHGQSPTAIFSQRSLSNRLLLHKAAAEEKCEEDII